MCPMSTFMNAQSLTCSAYCGVQLRVKLCNLECCNQIRGSIVVSISACHAEDPGSIPGRGVLLFSAIDICSDIAQCQRVARRLPKRQARHRGDSNPCGQSPMDFESISLTARTQCHMPFIGSVHMERKLPVLSKYKMTLSLVTITGLIAQLVRAYGQ